MPDTPVSYEQRLKAGRERRKQLARAALGELKPKHRNFDPIKLVFGITTGRVPRLLKVKYSRMAVSPFAFFRGAAPLMAADLAAHPHTDLRVQLCGDAHVQNLGCFAAPDGSLVFDINDFDETAPGPWEWDVKRMASSIVLAGLESGHSWNSSAAAAQSFAESYCETICCLGQQPILVAARHQIHRTDKVAPISAALQQAQRATPQDLVKKYTTGAKNSRIRFKKVESTLWPLRGPQKQDVLQSLPLYRQSLDPEKLHLFDFFRPLDVAFKIVGTGSVGLRDFVVLMQGNGEQDTLFLQIKQEVDSAYAPYLKDLHFDQQGRRVAEGQRRIQPLSDLLLGWTKIGEHDYLVRQLNDHKGSIDLSKLEREGLKSLAQIAGELLGRGHARSGDALEIKGYIGDGSRVPKAISEFAARYAELTQEDFAQFKRTLASRAKQRA